MSEEPAKIGKYSIIGTLGRGAMGVVYQGQDPEIGRVVALKTLRSITSANFPDKESAIERFKAEARSAGNLRHPNIVTVFDAHIDNDIPYIVMDYVEGKTLAKIIHDHGKLPPRKAIHYLKQIAAGLDAAHKNHVIHRDIKPNNIVVDFQDQAYILDFGVATLSESIASGDDSDEPVMGTPGYMSPEQIMSTPLDHRSDLFSFAIVAFECFASKRPFGGEDFREMVRNIVQEEPLPLSIPCPELPLSLEAEFGRALAKDRESRFPTATEMVSAFEATLVDLLNKPQSSAPKRQRQPSQWKSFGGEGEIREGHSRALENKPKTPPKSATELIRVKPKTSAPKPLYDEAMFTRSQSGGSLPGDLFANEESLISRGGGNNANSSSLFSRTALIAVAFLMMLTGVVIGLMQDGKPKPTQRETSGVPFSATETFSEVSALKKIEPVQRMKGLPVEQMSDEQIVSVLLDESSTETELFEALRIAKQRKIRDAVDASVAPLEHDSYAVRIETIKLLSSLGDKRIVPVLVKRLDDYDPLVRSHAAKTLGKLGSRAALGYLSTCYLKETNTDVKKAVKSAIEKINGYPMSE